MLYKFFWILRAVIYKPFFGKFGLPSYIGRPIYLQGIKNIHIGTRVRIFPGARIEIHGAGSLTIEDNVAIGQNLHCTCAADLTIGKNTLITADVMITDIDHEYRELGKPILEQPFLISPTSIGENCFIGQGVRIQAGTKLGKQCIVGTNSVLRGSFPDYCVIVGSPARVVRRFDTHTKQWQRVSTM